MSQHVPQANERLILVSLNIHQWRPTKGDKKAADELAKLHGIDDSRDVGNFNKRLASKDVIQPVQTAAREVRDLHDSMTAPWTHKGQCVLPADLYFEYCKDMGEAIEKFNQAADKFANEDYENEREARKLFLGGLFNANDYPLPGEIRGRFGIEYHMFPLPNPEDCRVWGIGDDTAAEIAADVERSVNESIQEAHAAIIARVEISARDFITKVERYSNGERQEKGRGNKLYDTAVTNLRDVVTTVLSGLNVTGDQSLNKLAQDLSNAVDGLSAGDLKSSLGLRDKKVKAVEKTLDKFEGMFK